MRKREKRISKTQFWRPAPGLFQHVIGGFEQEGKKRHRPKLRDSEKGVNRDQQIRKAGVKQRAFLSLRWREMVFKPTVRHNARNKQGDGHADEHAPEAVRVDR